MADVLTIDTLGDSISKTMKEPAEKGPNEVEENGGRDPSEHGAAVTNQTPPPAVVAAATAGVALALVPDSTGKETTMPCSNADGSKPTKEIETVPAITTASMVPPADDITNEPTGSKQQLIVLLHGKTKKKTATRPSFNLFLKQAADRAAWLTSTTTPRASNTTTTTFHPSHRTRRDSTSNTPALPMALSGNTSPSRNGKKKIGGGGNGNGNGSSSSKRKRDPASAMSEHNRALKRQNKESNSADTDSTVFHHRLMINGGGDGASEEAEQQEEFDDAYPHALLLAAAETSAAAGSDATKEIPHGFSSKHTKMKKLQQGNVVTHPRSTDVLLGRGSAIANTPGNVLFRQYVWDRKEAYRAAPRNSKFHVAAQLVNDIRNLHGGRFLEPSTTLTTKAHIVWCEAPLTRAVEKSCQALRELKMKEPTPLITAPLPPPSLERKKPKVPVAGQTHSLATATASPTTVTVGCAASPLTNNKSKVSSKSNKSSRYPKMPPGPRPVIEKPRKNDVLFGRGSQIALHPGNKQFREIVWQEKDEYQRTRNAGIKRDVALHVIGLVRELEPPGRFLELAGTSIMDGPWVESTPERILEKTSQALREQKWHWSSKAPVTGTAEEEMIELDDSQPADHEEGSSPWSYSDDASASVPDDLAQLEQPVATPDAVQVPPIQQKQMAMPVAAPAVVTPVQQYVGEEVLQDKSQEEQMALLREGSRIAIYWPLDEVFYPATVDDKLQDNFFYVKYDDGESEWIDLTRNSFYTLKPLAVAPAPRKEAAKKPKPSTKPTTKTAKTAKAKAVPKTTKTKPGPKTTKTMPGPSTSFAPTPLETASAEISINPSSNASAKPASRAKVKPVSTTSTKAASKASAKVPAKASTKMSSKAATKAAARAAPKPSAKIAAKIPVKAAKTVVKSSKGATKKAVKSPACGWSQRNKQIREGVAKYGTNNWEAVATMVPDWSAEECQRRFVIELDPELSREGLTGKEVRQIMRYQSEHGNVWVQLAFKMKRRATSFISEKWGRKIRPVAVEYVQKKTGLKVEKVEDPKTKKINYHGHFEGAYKAVMATHPF